MRLPTETRRAVASDPKRRQGRLLARSCGPGFRPARAVLGPDHPFTRAVEAVDRAGKQALAVGALLVGSIVDLSAGAAWAGAVALSAAIVLLGLVIVIAVLVQGRRDRAHDLILDGDESLPIAGVQRERRRLAAPRTQRLMARTIDGVVEQALNPPRICPRGARPLFKIAVVASVADDLHAISRALRAEHACIQGVVLAERLLSDGQSPLYGDQARLLREELHRIQKAL